MAFVIGLSFGTVFSYMVLWWIVAALARRNDLADIAWGLGFIVLGLTLMLSTGNFSETMLLMLVLITLWGLRLATHIGTRFVKKDEDLRYQNMREQWKHPRLRSLTDVFLLQGLFMLMVATPIMIAAADPAAELAWYNLVGVALWTTGFFFEVVGDWQLKKFIGNSKNKGKIMKSGVWHYTRHPNYFGEVTQWWGIFLIILFAPFWYVALIGPITITILILGLSGIPMLERRYEGNQEYERYQETTSAFFPWPPKTAKKGTEK